jgi:capsid protein
MTRILNEFGRPYEIVRRDGADARPEIRASYDAARLDGENAEHWAAADALDADSANSLAVRRRIAHRARYELGSNGQAKGVQLTQANYVVGRGPKLRMQTGSEGFNRMVEAAWTRWSAEVKLARKLRTMVKAKVSDGEGFLIVAQNPRMRNPVKLGLRELEFEQVTTPYLGFGEVNRIDGIEFDEFGNPTYYNVLKYHPGGPWTPIKPDAEQIPARFVLHLFRSDRPRQHRGVSEYHPSLNLFGQSRRYREATVSAAENLANITLLLKTQASPNEGPDLVRPLSTTPVEKNVIMGLPYGFDAWQPKAEQPTATYQEFTRSQACEQARPLNMPYNIAAADSSGYSFSGGKLDHVTYFVSVDVEQAELEDEVLEPLFELWFEEAALVYGWVRRDTIPAHAWDWPRKPVIDETKTATARKIDLSTGANHHRRMVAEDGFDADEEDQVAAKDLGMTVQEYRRALFLASLGAQQQDLEGNPEDRETQEDDQEDEEDENQDTLPARLQKNRSAPSRNGNGNGRVRV